MLPLSHPHFTTRHLLCCPWYRFLLTPTLLTTSLDESLYNYDCWWAMTQMCTWCHYMNIKVIHRQTGVEGPSAADSSHSEHCWHLHLVRVLGFICGFILYTDQMIRSRLSKNSYPQSASALFISQWTLTKNPFMKKMHTQNRNQVNKLKM